MSAALDLLTELVRADTVGAREGASARRCADLLTDAAFTVATPAWEPGREQLVARTGPGTPRSPSPATSTPCPPETPRRGRPTRGVRAATGTGCWAVAPAT